MSCLSHGNADILKAASAAEAERWKLELVSVQMLFSYACIFFWYFCIVVNIHNIKFSTVNF